MRWGRARLQGHDRKVEASPPAHTGHVAKPFLEHTYIYCDNIARASSCRIEGLQSTQTSSTCSGWIVLLLSSCGLLREDKTGHCDPASVFHADVQLIK